MKITAARVLVTCPGRNFVTLKIETDQGVYGIGDATLNGREKSVVSYLEDHVVPCLIGMDPRRIEDIWQYLYKGAYWRRGPVTMRAIAAVDMALWDIKGKMAGMPVYQLLGGRSRGAQRRRFGETDDNNGAECVGQDDLSQVAHDCRYDDAAIWLRVLRQGPVSTPLCTPSFLSEYSGHVGEGQSV